MLGQLRATAFMRLSYFGVMVSGFGLFSTRLGSGAEGSLSNDEKGQQCGLVGGAGGRRIAGKGRGRGGRGEEVGKMKGGRAGEWEMSAKSGLVKTFERRKED